MSTQTIIIIVAIVVVLVLVARGARSGPRVTQIDRVTRKDKEGGER